MLPDPCRRGAAAFQSSQLSEAFVVAYPLFLLKLLICSGVARFLPGVQGQTGGARGYLRHYSNRALAASAAASAAPTSWGAVSPPDVIDLALGAPCFDLLPSGTTKLPADRRGCPPEGGLPELRQAVADYLHAAGGPEVQPGSDVLITPGVTGAFDIALDALVNPGDRVVLFDPTSPLYRHALAQLRVRVRTLPTWLDAGRLRFRFEQLVQALHGARMIVLTSPANPTGGILNADDLEQIAWWAHRRDVLIFNDTAFERYCYDAPAPSIAAQPKARRHVLTAGSVSKGHALAAARVGWLAGHRHLIRPCALTARSILVPSLCQQQALAALRQSADVFTPIRTEFDVRRHYAQERLQASGLKPVWPAGGFFTWLPVQELGLAGRAFAERLLAVKRVLVCPGEQFGPSGAGHVRLSCAAEDGRFREGLKRLCDLVHELRRESPVQSRRSAA
jgi:aspartate/methionine/tyrosine aminotransferase